MSSCHHSVWLERQGQSNLSEKFLGSERQKFNFEWNCEQVCVCVCVRGGFSCVNVCVCGGGGGAMGVFVCVWVC